MSREKSSMACHVIRCSKGKFKLANRVRALVSHCLGFTKFPFFLFTSIYKSRIILSPVSNVNSSSRYYPRYNDLHPAPPTRPLTHHHRNLSPRPGQRRSRIRRRVLLLYHQQTPPKPCPHPPPNPLGLPHRPNPLGHALRRRNARLVRRLLTHEYRRAR